MTGIEILIVGVGFTSGELSEPELLKNKYTTKTHIPIMKISLSFIPRIYENIVYFKTEIKRKLEVLSTNCRPLYLYPSAPSCTERRDSLVSARRCLVFNLRTFDPSVGFVL